MTDLDGQLFYEPTKSSCNAGDCSCASSSEGCDCAGGGENCSCLCGEVTQDPHEGCSEDCMTLAEEIEGYSWMAHHMTSPQEHLEVVHKCRRRKAHYDQTCGANPKCPRVECPSGPLDIKPPRAHKKCMEKCNHIKDIKTFGECYCCCWSSLQDDRQFPWHTGLISCPCTVDTDKVPYDISVEHLGANHTLRVNEMGFLAAPFHPGAAYEVRYNQGGFGQQCTYDAAGKLITGGEGAGTPDVISPGLATAWGHREEDVMPFSACKNAGMTDCYMHHRPPNNGNNCESNVAPAPANGESGAKPDGELCDNKCNGWIANVFRWDDK